MTGLVAVELPAWAAGIVLALVLGGAAFSLIGAVGLARLPSFYERVHAPTLASTLGAALVLAASVAFSAAAGRPSLSEFLIGAFLTVTTPVSLMLLARAAAYRQRAEENPDAPPEP